MAWEHETSRELRRLAWPMIISLLSVTVASLVDTVFVGHLGALPLAGVGLGGVFSFTVISFGLAVFGAVKVKVGEATGRGETERVRALLGVFVLLALPLGVLSLIVGCLVAAWVMPLLGGEPETKRLAAEYLAIRSLSFPTVLFVAALAAWLQGQGRPRAPMQAAVVGTLVHIPLNAWFLFGLDAGVRGLACATVLSQLAETLCLLGLLRLPRLGLRQATFAQAWAAFRLGLPTGIERVLDMAAFAAVPLLLFLLGSVPVAAHQITLQLAQLSFLPLLAIAEAATILVSQVIGAQRRELIRSVARASLSLSLLCAAALAAVFFFGRHRLVGFFTSDQAVQTSAAQTLVFAALLQFVNAGYNVLKGVLRGLSAFRYVAQVTVGVAWLVTPPFTYLVGVVLGWGAPGAWFVVCLEVSLGTLLLGYRLWQLRLPSALTPPTASS